MNAEVYIEAAARAIAQTRQQPADWRDYRRGAKGAILATIDALIKDLQTKRDEINQ